MTSPQYVNDLASLYTRMYNHPGDERPLEENFEPSNKANVEVVEDEEPNWKKLIRNGLKKQKRHMAPTIADVPRDDIPDAHEEEEHQLSDNGLVLAYIDALEKKKILDDEPGGYREGAEPMLNQLVGQISKLRYDYNIESGDPLFDQIIQIEEIVK